MLRSGKDGFPAEEVGKVVLRTLTTARPRVRYAVVRGSFLRRLILRLAPKRVIDNFIARNFGFR
jgi:hypothetical protein